MGNLEKVLIVIILATIAVITALAFLDSGTTPRSEDPAHAARTAKRDTAGVTEPAPLWTQFSSGRDEEETAGADPGPIEIPPRSPEDASTSGAVSDGSDGEATLPEGDATDEEAGSETPSEAVVPAEVGSSGPDASIVDPVPPPPARGGFPYLVRAGDTFRSIAADLFGDPDAERVLRDANRDVRSPEPEPGTVLFIPGADAHAREASKSAVGDREPSPGKAGTEPADDEIFHVVKKGETLSKISRQYFDTPARWKEIFEANRDVIPAADKLRPGMRIRIPTGGTR
jgi:nucleoid-associated protein YgaU